MPKLSFVCMLFASMLTACSMSPTADCTRLPGGQYCLQPATALPPFTALQTVDLRMTDGPQFRMVASLEADGQHLRMAGLTPFGQKLFSIDYLAGPTVLQSANPLAQNIDAQYVMTLLQWVLWPAQEVRKGLSPDLRLEEVGLHRRIYSGETLLVDIERSGNTLPYAQVRVKIPVRQIEVEIHSVDESEVGP